MLLESDPQKIIHYALTSNDLTAHGARRILMSWIMSLPQEADPAAAAKALAASYAQHLQRMQGPMQNELLELLSSVAENRPPEPRRKRVNARRRRGSARNISKE